MEFFYAATTITIGDGKTANFWNDPWLHGLKPKDIAPSIYGLSSRKNFTVNSGLTNDFWVNKINTAGGLSLQNIEEFVALWPLVDDMRLVEGTPDDITWKFTNSGSYSASSAYKAQFEGLIRSLMPELVWNNWAPPKCKLFVWLVLQDRVWTADRLHRRGWPNCGLCQLCKREEESVAHLLFKCRYTLRICNMIFNWLGLPSFDTASWATHNNVEEWWKAVIYTNGVCRKSIASLMMLISWEIWNERNARVFRKVSSMPSSVVVRIKNEANLWSIAGAKKLGSIMPRE
jgi:hypothetical protein